MSVEKIRNKARWFWKHGKHAKVDPILLRRLQERRRAKPPAYGSIRELMERERGRGIRP